MDYQMSTELEIIVWTVSVLLASLVLLDISRNNKKHLDDVKPDQVDSFVISDYRIPARFIDIVKTAIIFSVTSYPLIVAASVIVVIVGRIWPISLSWLFVIYIGLFTFWFCFVFFLLFVNLSLRLYPQTVLYHELSGFFRRQGKYVWTVAHKPFLVVDASGISGKVTLPWNRVYDVRLLDDTSLLIKFNRKPRWLAKILNAESFVLVVPEIEQAKKVVDVWHSYHSK